MEKLQRAWAAERKEATWRLRRVEMQSTIEAIHESEGEREGGREFEEQRRWVIDLQSKIGTINYEREVEIQRKKCIYRVPRILRGLNEDAYTPQLFSFGPYHHGKAHLKLMESYKPAPCPVPRAGQQESGPGGGGLQACGPGSYGCL
ncbi:uncharacterized protein A4U43_C01F34890 [Asparagus officinalis]|uniref:Uncharacterized protein n=1 Tax=Asparagus officinalis TaxID=4686 RepID=A0A5P1FXR0_ASPOF|nr:uncharacterized protein A4U43_C01F34890 [Asparagus officinalis]